MTGTIKAPVLVLGATGTVGRGVVGAALAAGLPVVAVARDARRLATLAATHAGSDLTVLSASVTDDADGARLAATLHDFGRPVRGVVAAIAGPAYRGRLLDQPASALCAGVCADVVPHLVAARALLPLLSKSGRGGTYVLIGGPAGTRPWSGYGARSIAAASLRMLAQVLHDEALPLGVRVQLLSVEAPVAQGPQACAQWPTAEAIGRRALALLDRPGTTPVQPVVACGDQDAAPPPWLQDARALLQTLTSPHPQGRGLPHETP